MGVTDLDEAVGKNRKQGITDALADHGIPLDDSYCRTSDFTLQSGYEQACSLLTSCPKIDTILCATDTIAAGVIKYINEVGKMIPEDIQIAGIGDGTISQVTTPTLTTVHFYYKTAGMECTRLLLDMIKDPDHSIAKEIKLGFRIVENHSTRKTLSK